MDLGACNIRRGPVCIAHLKNWRILAYGYRRLTSNFADALAAVTKLEIYRTSTYAS